MDGATTVGEGGVRWAAVDVSQAGSGLCGINAAEAE
jgi:hypothetical protein